MKFHGLSLALSLCLSAGSGMAQVVYQPTVASFSSQNPYGIDRAASRTRDSSGLASGVSGIAGAADATHDRTVNGNMWTTRGITAAPNDTNPAITYDLGAVTNLQTIRLWNYNEFDLGVSYTKFGAKDIRVSTSPDNLTFTTLGDIQLAQGGATTAEPAQDFTAAVTAIRYVRFQILSNWDGASFWSPLNGPNNSGADGRFLVGLSEVRFVGVPTPPPAAAVSNPSPANAATAIEPGIALAWDTNNGEGSATGYRVIVGVGDPLYNYEVETANLATSASSRMTWQPPANVIQKGSLFWWRVEKTTAAGTVAGPTWTFTTRPETAAEKDARMAWFRNDKLFGAIVWGLYSGAEGVWPPAHGTKNPSWTYAEWMQFWANLSTLDLPRHARTVSNRNEFRRHPDGADVQGGRHGDGLCDAAPPRRLRPLEHPDHHAACAERFQDRQQPVQPDQRDYLKELVDALRAEGLRVGFYFSLGDWHHPDFPHSGIPWAHPRPGEANPPGHTEVWAELCQLPPPAGEGDRGTRRETGTGTDYGPFDVVYFDYSSSGINGEQWGATRLVHLVRRYNPDIIINNRLWNGLDNPNGDYATPEADVDNVGYNEYDRDWEAIMSANDPPTWGYGRPDLYPFKSRRDLVWDIVDVASKNGTIELSVSPKADGSLHPGPAQPIRRPRRVDGRQRRLDPGTTGNPVGSRPGMGRIHLKTRRRTASTCMSSTARRMATSSRADCWHGQRRAPAGPARTAPDRHPGRRRFPGPSARESSRPDQHGHRGGLRVPAASGGQSPPFPAKTCSASTATPSRTVDGSGMSRRQPLGWRKRRRLDHGRQPRPGNRSEPFDHLRPRRNRRLAIDPRMGLQHLVRDRRRHADEPHRARRMSTSSPALTA